MSQSKPLKHDTDTGLNFPVIKGQEIPKGFWEGLLGFRPKQYWHKLPFDVRQAIDRKTIENASERLTEDLKVYQAWYGEGHALQKIYTAVREHRWRALLEAKSNREKDVVCLKRVYCGARKKDGTQCKAKTEQGKNRCRFHGGQSTGPKTIEGKIKSLSALPQYRKRPELLEAKRLELERQNGA